MLEKNLNPRSYQHLDEIVERVNHMEEMIDQLLILSQLRDDTETMQIIDVNDVITRSLVRFPEIEMGNVIIQIQPDMPNVFGHSQWLEEVFANLISNSIKYMGHNNVADNGIGIREQDQERLFKKFTRLKEVQAEGLGLGLSIVHRIIEHFDGTLGVKSEWGNGTTFWFTIPRITTTRFKDMSSDN